MDAERMYRGRAYNFTVVAHLFGFLAIILLLVWLLQYRGGIDYDSEYAYRVFNVHPLMMFMGFIFFAGQAMMAYRTVPGDIKSQKLVHMFLHMSAIILGIVGLCAVFKFHDRVNLVDVYSLHSWIGLGTFVAFCLQWVFGFMLFMFRESSEYTRTRMAPWHVSAGKALLYMAVCAALTGLMETCLSLRLLPHDTESNLINFTGLAILLFGVFVDLSVSFDRYV